METAQKIYNDVEQSYKDFWTENNKLNLQEYIDLLQNKRNKILNIRKEIGNKVYEKRKEAFYTEEELKKLKKKQVLEIYEKVYKDIVGIKIKSLKSYTKTYCIKGILDFQKCRIIPDSFTNEINVSKVLKKCLDLIERIQNHLNKLISSINIK